MWCFVQWYVKVRTVYVALLKQRCKISVSSSSIGRAFCIEPEVVVRFPSGLIYFLHRKLHLFSHNITINENNISQFRCYSSCTWATIAWSHNALCDHVQSHPQMSAGCFMQIFKGLSPVTRNLCCQSARGNRSGAVRYFPEAVRPSGNTAAPDRFPRADWQHKFLVTGLNPDYNMVTVRV